MRPGCPPQLGTALRPGRRAGDGHGLQSSPGLGLAGGNASASGQHASCLCAGRPPSSPGGRRPRAPGRGHGDPEFKKPGVFRGEICLKQFPRTRGSPSACPEGESVSACSWTSSEGQKRQKNSRLSMFNPVPGRGHGPSKAGASTLP